jgi:hypothetical protein
MVALALMALRESGITAPILIRLFLFSKSLSLTSKKLTRRRISASKAPLEIRSFPVSPLLHQGLPLCPLELDQARLQTSVPVVRAT